MISLNNLFILFLSTARGIFFLLTDTQNSLKRLLSSNRNLRSKVDECAVRPFLNKASILFLPLRGFIFKALFFGGKIVISFVYIGH